MLCIGPQVCAIARPTGRCKHRPLRVRGQVSGKFCRISPPHGGNAPTGLRYPHHTAHAEACLHSATAAPAPSRCIRRRRRSTPQPLAGEPFQVAIAHKASPARGGAATGGGGVRRLALPLPFRTAAAPTKHRAGFCRALQDISAARRQCTPQSAPQGAASSPCRGAFQAAAPRKASPAREGAAAGGGGVRRLALPLSFRAAAAPA